LVELARITVRISSSVQLMVFEILVQDASSDSTQASIIFVSQLRDALFSGSARSSTYFFAEGVVIIDDLDLAHEVDEPGEQLVPSRAAAGSGTAFVRALAHHLEAHVESGADGVHSC